MTKVEKKVLEFIEKHVHVIFAVAVVLIGTFMRMAGRHFVSKDAGLFLLNWYDEIAENGISKQVGDYNIPYQILIYLMTKLPINVLSAFKMVSCIFDLGIALLAGLFAHTVSQREKQRNAVLAFTFVFCSPIVIMNSAVWAQCDAIYAFFALAALLMLFKEKYILSFVLWGLSLAFKLQAIYLLPFYLIYYVCRKKYSLLHFLVVPPTVVLASLPGLLAGRRFMEVIDIYVNQTKAWDVLYINYANVYALVADSEVRGNYEMFRNFAMFLTLLLLGIGLYQCVCRKAQLQHPKEFWGMVIWTLFTCNFFLTNMHERYAYLLEIIAILYCFITTKGIPLAVFLNLASIFTYAYFLFAYRAVSLNVAALAVFLLYAVFSVWMFRCVLGEEQGKMDRIVDTEDRD